MELLNNEMSSIESIKLGLHCEMPPSIFAKNLRHISIFETPLLNWISELKKAEQLKKSGLKLEKLQSFELVLQDDFAYYDDLREELMIDFKTMLLGDQTL